MHSNSNTPKKKASQRSVDGFVYSARPDITSERAAFESRYRKSYRPSAIRTQYELSDTQSFAPRPRQVAGFSESRSISSPKFTNKPLTTKKEGFKLFRRRTASARKKPSTLRRLTRSFAIVFVALLIGVSSLFAYGFLKARNIFEGDGEGAAGLQKNVDPAKLNGEGDGRVNILMIGRGGDGHEAPDLTDTILLASIDPVQNEAALVSVPRDLYIKTQGGGGTKINAVYSNAKQLKASNSGDTDQDVKNAENAGIEALEDVVSDVLGVPIHYYVMVDFQAFEKAIDTVGGVTVDVKEPLYDSSVAWLLGGNPLVAGEGLQTFDGKRALLYARSRKGSARGDFDRAERQKEILIALQKKMLSAGTFSNPFKIVELMNNLGDHVRTDLNGVEEIKRLYEIGQNIGDGRIGSLGLADPPNVLVTTDMVGDQSVVVPTAGLYQYEEIHSYVRNNMRDAFLKSEDAKVVILNGTTIAGFATARSAELKSYGYNVVSVDNAPSSDYIQSLIIDNSGGTKKYTASYLEKRMGLTVSDQQIPGIPTALEADFVIILGTDEATDSPQ